jgi:hypothetical protein
MKNLSFIVVVFIIFILAISGCSRKTSDKMIGKWKADSVSGMNKSMQAEVYYEFTKDSIIAYGFVHTQPLDRISMPYKFKSEDRGLLTIEATQTSTGQTGDFTVSIDGNKMTLIDPSKNAFILTKQ